MSDATEPRVGAKPGQEVQGKRSTLVSQHPRAHSLPGGITQESFCQPRARRGLCQWGRGLSASRADGFVL